MSPDRITRPINISRTFQIAFTLSEKGSPSHHQLAHHHRLSFKLLFSQTAVDSQGATILDQRVCITRWGQHHEEFDFWNATPRSFEDEANSHPTYPQRGEFNAGEAVTKAQEVVKTMLATGFVLGKDALTKAKAFDESHGVSAAAAARVSQLDQRFGLADKIFAGVEAVRLTDKKYHVSDKAKSAVSATGRTAAAAASSVVNSSYFSSGALWLSGALERAAKAASDLGFIMAASSIPPSTAATSVVRKSLLLSTTFSFPASSLSSSVKLPQKHIHKRLILASSSSSAVPSDSKPAAKKETVYFDGGAHYGDLLANLVLGLTILWLPLTLAAVSRAFNLRYRFTNLRVTVISGLTGEDRSDFSYKVIKDVQVVPRFIGEWGDIIITLRDGTKVDLRSVPKFREIAKYCLSMADQPAVVKESGAKGF
ncbi:unnamed protein product [Eruca vesicaria subsp. sativa]|uniref:YdbS-like PH domain-containing protein n=1 Tax=Eruca vesicaria subsp. sativa TaxID=29727 RepID=A0ABC8K6M6_ERUVS|nr:unnamed protein product [Eruca vesicaria subsp. sativa]